MQDATGCFQALLCGVKCITKQYTKTILKMGKKAGDYREDLSATGRYAIIELMLLLAHTGITVGLTWLTQKSVPWVRTRMAEPALIRRNVNLPADPLRADPPQVTSVAPALDYRLLLVGSILPDIIDKPLGIWLLRETLSSGRIFAHTLVFAAVLAGVGLYFYVKRRWLGALCLALGTVAHLILDQMWLNLRTLLWPLYGLSFERGIVEDWLPRILTSLVTDPRAYCTEIIGALLLAMFVWYIIRHGKLASFLRSGRVG